LEMLYVGSNHGLLDLVFTILQALGKGLVYFPQK